jgi:hypothetical protein
MERIDGVGRDQQADARTACVDLGSGFLSQRANAMRDRVKNGVFMGCPSQHRHIYIKSIECISLYCEYAPIVLIPQYQIVGDLKWSDVGDRRETAHAPI